jgi:hypothetical protein
VVGAGACSGFGVFAGLACFSGFALPCFACEGGTAGVAGVAGLAAGGFADLAGMAGVARSGVFEPPVGLGPARGGEAEGPGALAVGGDPALVPVPPPPEVGCPGEGLLGVGAGAAGVPPAGEEPGAGPRTVVPAGPLETKIGVKPENGDGATGFFTGCGRAGETNTGTLRTCVLGTASSRVAECSSTVKACTQSWADATAPAATAPT